MSRFFFSFLTFVFVLIPCACADGLNVTDILTAGDSIYDVTFNRKITVKGVRLKQVTGSYVLLFPSAVSKTGREYPFIIVKDRQTLDNIRESLVNSRVSRSDSAIKCEITGIEKNSREGYIKAFAWVKINGVLFLQAKVMKKGSDAWVSWPGVKKLGKWQDVVAFTDTALKKGIEKDILKRYLSKN